MRDASTSILAEAQRLVYGPKEEAYGDATIDLKRIALMWSVILEQPVEPYEVAMCMVALKLSRLCHKRGRDSWIDVAGWADVGAQVDCDQEAGR